jgi:hypothetical protein
MGGEPCEKDTKKKERESGTENKKRAEILFPIRM